MVVRKLLFVRIGISNVRLFRASANLNYLDKTNRNENFKPFLQVGLRLDTKWNKKQKLARFYQNFYVAVVFRNSELKCYSRSNAKFTQLVD